MDNPVDGLVGKWEIEDVSAKEPNGLLRGQMRHPEGKCFRVAAENRDGQIEVEPPIAESQTLKQPGAEKTRTSGDKDALPAYRLPKCLRRTENVFKVLSWERYHALSIYLPGCAISVRFGNGCPVRG